MPCSEITVREVFVQLSLARCVLMREREKREKLLKLSSF